MKRLKKGTRVLVRAWRSGERKNISLIYNSFRGHLLDDCSGEGWNIVEVRRFSGLVTSVYSFSVERDPMA